MPYCVQCGTSVQETDLYCAKCGSRQPSAGRTPVKNVWDEVSPKTVSQLCYIPLVGWIVSIVVIASDRFRNDLTVRFHAFQGLYLYVAYLVVDWFIGPLFSVIAPDNRLDRVIPHLAKAAIYVAWVMMLIKTGHNENVRLPVVGELADRSVAEQV